MARKLLYVVGGIVLLLILVALLLPLFVDVNSYRPKIESAATEALGRKVALGKIGLSVFSGGVSVDDVAVADDPAFGNGSFLKAKSVTVGVKMMPLIFSRALEVTGVTIDEPEVTLLRSAAGKWNLSTLGGAAKPPAGGAPRPKEAAPSGPGPAVSVDNLRIRNGKLIVGDLGAKTKPREYTQLNLEVSNLSYTSQFPFTFSATAPGNGSVKLSGKAGPLNQTDAEQTPLEANLEVRSLDLTFTGLADPASGIAGIVDFTGTVNSDGKRVDSKGKITASKLQLAPGSSPSTQPVQLDYTTSYQLGPQTGALTQCDVHVGKALARLTGTYNAAGATPSVQMKLDGKDMPLMDLAAVLPAVGVTLPSGASLKEGTMNANLAISGPANRLVTTGPVVMSNARLAGYDLGSKMGAMSAFAGVPKGSDTVIQNFSSTLRVAPEGIKADAINVVVQGIGALNGAGTVNAEHALDFKMTAQLSGGASPLGAISKISSGGQGGKGGLPFLIKGTTTNPLFVPDMAGLAGSLGKGVLSDGQGAAGGAAGGAKDVGGALGGLFGGKKK